MTSQIIQKYKIIETLQQSYNGSRSTYLAETCKGEKVVLKEFKFVEKSSEWGDYKRIEKELATLSKLDHSNIPKVLETFESDNELYLVIEYISGRSLDEKDLSLEEVISLCKSLLNLLEYIQQKNIVHRDIKPQNIILGDDKKYYLIDFGLATPVQYSITSSSIIAGTLGFMPPELLRQQKLGNSADLYSLAVTIYCLISKTTNSDLGKLIDSRNVLSISALDTLVSSKFKLWLSACLEPDPQDRFSNAKKAISEFEKILSFEPDKDIPSKFKLKKKKPKIFNLKTIGYLIVGLVALAAVIYGIFVLCSNLFTYLGTIDWNTPTPADQSTPIPTDQSSNESELQGLIKGLSYLFKIMIYFPLGLGILSMPLFIMQGDSKTVLNLMFVLALAIAVPLLLMLILEI